ESAAQPARRKCDGTRRLVLPTHGAVRLVGTVSWFRNGFSYSAFHKWPEWPGRILQGLKPLNSPALFGPTEVVPFHDTNDETRSSFPTLFAKSAKRMGH